ncbi:MAG: PAS domain S-box protein [Bacteroidia bacterium]|nr:PAS domain S-box protein [Bacteroidia bacterium]
MVKRPGVITESRYLRKDQTSISVRKHISGIRDRHGQIKNLAVIIEDITERKKAEYALQESEHRFRNLAEEAPMLIWMSRAQANVMYANKLMLDYFGFSNYSELTRQSWENAIYPDDLPQVHQTYREAYETKQSYTLELRLRSHTGQFRWFLLKAVPRLMADGEISGIYWYRNRHSRTQASRGSPEGNYRQIAPGRRGR